MRNGCRFICDIFRVVSVDGLQTLVITESLALFLSGYAGIVRAGFLAAICLICAALAGAPLKKALTTGGTLVAGVIIAVVESQAKAWSICSDVCRVPHGRYKLPLATPYKSGPQGAA
jgi:hypothetical protein